MTILSLPNKKLLAAVPLVSFIITIVPPEASAFGIPTHRAITLRATGVANLDVLLKQRFPELSAGVNEVLEGEDDDGTTRTRQVHEWLQEGAEDEDLVRLRKGRFCNHFHDPTVPWSIAGLRASNEVALYCGFQSNSAAIWQQLLNQSSSGYGGGDRSWQDARKHFLDALTLGSEADRRGAWAQTFYSLGHVVHMIQDAGNPAHTRNDGHYPLLNPDSFETWAANNGEPIINGHAPVLYTGAFTKPTDTSAPAPIANLIDANQYVLTNPSDSSTFGLAEVSNSMFFGDDTQTDGFYPHPTLPSSKQDLFDAAVQYMRQYWAGAHVVGLVSSIGRFVINARFDAALDDNVLQTHGDELLPRAVGYTASAFEYFLRGDIDLRRNPAAPRQFLVSNEGPELMSGDVSIYYDDAAKARHLLVTATNLTLPSGGQDAMSFAEPTDNLVPGRYIVVFSGNIGGEQRSAGDTIGGVVGEVVYVPDVGPFCLPAFSKEQWNGTFCWYPDPYAENGDPAPLQPYAWRVVESDALPHVIRQGIDQNGSSTTTVGYSPSDTWDCKIRPPFEFTPDNGWWLAYRGRLEFIEFSVTQSGYANLIWRLKKNDNSQIQHIISAQRLISVDGTPQPIEIDAPVDFEGKIPLIGSETFYAEQGLSWTESVFGSSRDVKAVGRITTQEVCIGLEDEVGVW